VAFSYYISTWSNRYIVAKKTASKKVIKKAIPKKAVIKEKANPPIQEQTKTTNMIQISLPITIPTNPCILKIKAKGKYLIAKTHNILWLSSELPRQYERLKEGKLPTTGLYYSLLAYCYQNSIPAIEIEVLFTDVNGYQCLKFELEYLTKHYGKRNCLNKNRLPHVPKTPLTGKGATWLTVTESLNYQKLLKKKGF
jgi:hypothetical protein